MCMANPISGPDEKESRGKVASDTSFWDTIYLPTARLHPHQSPAFPALQDKLSAGNSPGSFITVDIKFMLPAHAASRTSIF